MSGERRNLWADRVGASFRLTDPGSNFALRPAFPKWIAGFLLLQKMVRFLSRGQFGKDSSQQKRGSVKC